MSGRSLFPVEGSQVVTGLSLPLSDPCLTGYHDPPRTRDTSRYTVVDPSLTK